MPEVTMDRDLEATTRRRTAELFDEHRQAIYARTDRIFSVLLGAEWVFAIVLALVVSPRAWAGTISSVHPHVWAALVLGGSIASLPVLFAVRFPGRAFTRHTIACGQMLMSALLIHLTGGRIETHFHVFGSLAFLAFYRDWKVLVPATLVVAGDHYIRGLLWPQSVYGVLEPGGWRWLEHAGWVVFEDVFLVMSCLQGTAEMRSIAERRAQLEATNELVERAVQERTRELAESEARFEAFMDNSPAVAFIKDGNGRYLHVNRTFERLFGKTRADVVGLSDHELWANDVATQVVEADRRVLAGEQEGETLETIPVEGEPHQWSVYRFVISDAGEGRLLGGFALDMTEKLELAERLRQTSRMEAVGRLAGGIAHDFNNLLTAVTGYAQLLLRDAKPDESVHRYATEITRAADRAASLTRQMLAYGRKQMLQPKVIDLNQVLGESEDLLRRLLGDEIHLALITDRHPCTVMADPGQIEQVILNLILNTRDAMPGGGRVTIEIAGVDLAADVIGLSEPVAPGHYILLAVSDTGYGMNAETRSRVFEPFFTTKEMGKGTGLGLSTAHGIVAQSGGHISVYSEVGIGSTFKVYLPAVVAETGAAEPVETRVAGPRGRETLLLVEDEEGLRNMVREVLEAHGYEVVVAQSGEEAIEISKRALDRVHMLVTDVVMPGLNGRQVADRLCNIQPGLRVLFMSGYAQDAIVRHGVLDPGIDFIAKPFTPDQLATRVREILDRRIAA